MRVDDAIPPLLELTARLEAGYSPNGWDGIKKLCREALKNAEGSPYASRIAVLAVHCVQRRPAALMAEATNIVRAIEAEHSEVDLEPDTTADTAGR